MKLNLGAGGVPVSGYHQVDLDPPADFVGDFTQMTFEGIEAVEMSHVLEHISHHRTVTVLDRIRSWMLPGAPIRVEVPDCAELLKLDPTDPNWQQWWFGSQEGAGKDHLAGFVAETLRRALAAAGWREISTRTFRSERACRDGYPCLEGTAIA